MGEIKIPTSDQIAALNSKIDALNSKIDALTSNGNLKTQLNGNITELFGRSINERPLVSSVPIGTTFMIIKTEEIWQSDGTEWVVK